MDRTDLVVLKGLESVQFKTDTLNPHRYYRHIQIEDQHMVFGIIFDDDKFNDLFEFAHDRVIRDFQKIGILGSNLKPISKSLFAKLADIHTYGYGRKNVYHVWYFRNTRECIYGFYPMQGNKKSQLNECYEYYLDLVNGNVESLDVCDVRFGNCGIPLVYDKLRIQYI
jgi:hypothetical protein